MSKVKIITKGTLPKSNTVTTRIGDYGYDPRFDPRVKEQERLNNLTTTVERRSTDDVPELYLPDYEGQGYVSSMSDRTAAGGMLVDINGVPLNRPIDMRGGQDYMFENPGQVWASADEPTRAIMMQAAAAKALTGKDPLYLPWRMAPTGGDFAHMTGETMLSFAESNMGKGAKRSLNKQIKQFIPDWKGVDSPDSIDQYRQLPDVSRKAMKNMMDTQFRNDGGLGIGEARLSVTDPRQLTSPEGYLMNVGRIFADKPMVEVSGHPSYPKGVPGEGLGRISDERSLFELNPREFPRDKSIREQLLNPESAPTAYENLSDVMTTRSLIDPRVFTSDDTRALQMKPYYGILTEEILRKMGYAEGGMVDSAPEEAIKNTVTNPQAQRMLDMDLANLALMGQPQRMGKGGSMKPISKMIKAEGTGKSHQTIHPNIDPFYLKIARKEIDGVTLSDSEYNDAIGNHANLSRIGNVLEQSGWQRRGSSNVSPSTYYTKDVGVGEYHPEYGYDDQLTHEIRLSNHNDRHPAGDDVTKRYHINYTNTPSDWADADLGYHMSNKEIADRMNDILPPELTTKAKGGAVRMADGGFLQNALRSVVPAQTRTFIDSLAGNESPITEGNFSVSELDMMRDAIMRSRRDRQATNSRLYSEAMGNAKTDKERSAIRTKGISQDLDQTVGYQHYPGGMTDLASDMNPTSSAAIRNTLGRFAYNKDADGNLIATDLYKFRDDLSGKTRPTADYADMGRAEKLKTLFMDSFTGAGIDTLPSRVGNAYLGHKEGRPVNVNLGKAPFAHGGKVPSTEEMMIELMERGYVK